MGICFPGFPGARFPALTLLRSDQQLLRKQAVRHIQGAEMVAGIPMYGDSVKGRPGPVIAEGFQAAVHHTLFVVIPEKDFLIPQPRLFIGRLQIACNKIPFLPGFIMAGFPALLRFGFILYGDTPYGNPFFFICLQVTSGITGPGFPAFLPQTAALIHPSVGFHPGGRTPGRCEQPQIRRFPLRRQHHGDHVLLIPFYGKIFQFIVFRRVVIGRDFCGKITSVDGEPAEIITKALLFIKICIQDLLPLPVGQGEEIYRRCLCKGSSKTHDFLVFHLIIYVQYMPFIPVIAGHIRFPLQVLLFPEPHIVFHSCQIYFDCMFHDTPFSPAAAGTPFFRRCLTPLRFCPERAAEKHLRRLFFYQPSPAT